LKKINKQKERKYWVNIGSKGRIESDHSRVFTLNLESLTTIHLH